MALLWFLLFAAVIYLSSGQMQCNDSLRYCSKPLNRGNAALEVECSQTLANISVRSSKAIVGGFLGYICNSSGNITCHSIVQGPVPFSTDKYSVKMPLTPGTNCVVYGCYKTFVVVISNTAYSFSNEVTCAAQDTTLDVSVSVTPSAIASSSAMETTVSLLLPTTQLVLAKPTDNGTLSVLLYSSAIDERLEMTRLIPKGTTSFNNQLYGIIAGSVAVVTVGLLLFLVIVVRKKYQRREPVSLYSSCSDIMKSLKQKHGKRHNKKASDDCFVPVKITTTASEISVSITSVFDYLERPNPKPKSQQSDLKVKQGLSLPTEAHLQEQDFERNNAPIQSITRHDDYINSILPNNLHFVEGIEVPDEFSIPAIDIFYQFEATTHTETDGYTSE